MEEFRSNSYRDGSIQEDYKTYHSHRVSEFKHGNHDGHYKPSSNPSGMQDLRCYSTSYATSCVQNNGQMMDIVVSTTGGDPWKFKKGKSTNGVSYKNWTFKDPELLRKKRVASYKAYTVEGKVKGSVKKSFRWLKERCNQMLYGYR